jgi:hypothetical protein
VAESFFAVEDFIQSILVQLDRVQDALRMKSVNRPLTYALKDFSLDFHVFADVDKNGAVRFRPASANETGSSTLRLGFTTITKQMIDENTVSLAATRSPTLDQLGLAPEEVRRLEALGVRTASQLNRLQGAAGQTTVARWANVPSMRLKDALVRAQPTVQTVHPLVPRAPAHGPAAPSPVPAPRQIRLVGRNLLGSNGPRARFDDQPIDVSHAADDEIVVSVPADAPHAGTLEIAFDDDVVKAFDVTFPNGSPAGAQAALEPDPWGAR